MILFFLCPFNTGSLLLVCTQKAWTLVYKLSFLLFSVPMGSLLLSWTPEGWKSAHKRSLFLCPFNMGSLLLVCTQRAQSLSINCPFFPCQFSMGSLSLFWIPEGWKSVPKWSLFQCTFDMVSLLLVCTQRAQNLSINGPFSFVDLLWVPFCCYEPQRAFSYFDCYGFPFVVMNPWGLFFLCWFDMGFLLLLWTLEG